MVRSSLVQARYGSPERVRLWQFKLDGDARCLADAPLVSEVDATTLTRLDNAAALIRLGLSLAEQYEAAERVREPGESVPTTVPVYDDETGEQTGTEPHPLWAAYDAAQAHMAAATPDTVRFVIVRRGEPERYEADGETERTEWTTWRAAQDRFEAAVSSILETAPLLTSPEALPGPASPPDFLPA
jgi:hypothetical protein